MTAKEKYRILCDNEPSIPLYNKAWWLDAVCLEGEWQVAIIENQETIIAALPYYTVKKLGTTQIVMPPYTQCLGAWINSSYLHRKNNVRTQSEFLRLYTGLIEQLPHVDRFIHNLNPEVTNCLPFYWAKYDTSVRYTYKIPASHSKELVWDKMHKDFRKKIRRAEISTSISFEIDCDNIIQTELDFCKAKGITLQLPEDNLRQLIQKAQSQNAIHSVSAKNKTGQLGALTCFSDDHSYYALIGSINLTNTSSGSQYLLYWKMIQEALLNNRGFDFEGSMLKNIEHRNRNFGAQQTPYFSITKYKSKFHEILFGLRNK